MTAKVYRTKVPFRSAKILPGGNFVDLLFIFGVSGVVFGGACAIVASNKKRDALGWFVLGFFFNLVALIVIAALSPSEAVEAVGDKNVNRDVSTSNEDLRLKAVELKAAMAATKAKLGR